MLESSRTAAWRMQAWELVRIGIGRGPKGMLPRGVGSHSGLCGETRRSEGRGETPKVSSEYLPKLAS